MKVFLTATLLYALVWLTSAVQKVYVEDMIAKENLKLKIILKGRNKHKHFLADNPLNLPKEEDLEPVLTVTLPSKDKITRFAQEFQDVPVYGSHVTSKVDKKTGKPIGDMAGVIYKGIKEDIKDIKTSITKEKALEIARKHHNHTDVFETSTELMIYPKGDDAYLAYKVTYISSEELASPITMVDAKKGTVLASFPGISTATHKLKGYGGNRQIGRTEFTGEAGKLAKLELTIDPKNAANCVMDTEAFNVYDLGGERTTRPLDYWRKNIKGKNVPSVTYNCKTDPIPDHVTKDSFNVPNDVFYYVFHVLKMFESMQLKASTTKITVLVNYDDRARLPYGGMVNQFILIFNDGGRAGYSFVSYPEVVAHELAHAVTTHYDGLERSGESGAMNEAFSDMTGERFKNYIGKPNDWLFAKGYLRGKPDEPARSLKDPTSWNGGIDHMDKLDMTKLTVHQASGIYSKAFYLLSTTKGWDIEKAYDVFALANRAHWGPTTKMHDGSCGVQNAATSLKLSKHDVINAFEKVGVQCPRCHDMWCTILR